MTEQLILKPLALFWEVLENGVTYIAHNFE